MKTVIRLVSLVAVLALLGALLSGCEDTDVVLSGSGVISLTATPGAIHFDPETDVVDPDLGIVVKGSLILATVFDDSNRPHKGVTVVFESNSGFPVVPISVETDENGRAEGALLVGMLDQGTITVTAKSGVVSSSVPIEVTVEGANQLPRAALSIIPGGNGQVGDIVTFDGSGSLDPDSRISCYQWEFESDNPDSEPNPWIVQGVAASGVQETFSNEQTLAVTLRVSDRTDIVCQDVAGVGPGGAGVEPVANFSPFAALTQYEVQCNNPPPTAVIAGTDPRLLTGTPSTLTSVQLDGTLSSDDKEIDRFVWTCGNEFTPLNVTGNGSVVICKYRLGTYTATLQVVDNGTGELVGGDFVCQKFSDADTVGIVVSTP
jgi:hypothetical protein